MRLRLRLRRARRSPAGIRLSTIAGLAHGGRIDEHAGQMGIVTGSAECFDELQLHRCRWWSMASGPQKQKGYRQCAVTLQFGW